MHRIVIVGGGVGGLELAIRLGRKLGKKGKADVTLIDQTLTHIWKPLLHEVAAGTLDASREEMDYLTLAQRNGFRFRLGRMQGLDRQHKKIALTAMSDSNGRRILPASEVPYDTLVLALGSVGHDYGIPGVSENCIFLDSREQADRFQTLLLNLFLRSLYQPQNTSIPLPVLQVVIVGAGATGVELAAELHKVSLKARGFATDRQTDGETQHITLIEAGARILPALPEKVARAAARQLKSLGVDIKTSARVKSITPEGVTLATGEVLPAHLKVWAAGIKAPDFFGDLDGLQTSPLNQLMVNQDLATPGDPDIFAIGDCAYCPQPDSARPVPPRAQAAHQQAATLAKSLVRRLNGGSTVAYVYKDYGSLVSLSHSYVGNLMGNLTGNRFIAGWLARMIYLSLYRSHQWVLHGAWRTFVLMTMDMLARRVKPRLKLH